MVRRKSLVRTIVFAAMIVVGVGLLTIGGIEAWRWFSTTHSATPSLSTTTVTESTSTPDETPPTEACQDYTVDAHLPRKISIETIGVSGCIERVGVDQHGAVAVPTNIHAAGWYTQSVLPGEKGVSLIDGHVLGRYNDAIFAKLADVRAGNVIVIEFGDGAVKKFEVKEIDTYDLAAAQDEFLKQSPDIDTQLTLITCGGTYDSQAKTYDKRVIVRAAQQ